MSVQSKMLATILVILLSFGLGAYVGHDYADGQHAKTESKVKDAVIDGVRRAANTDREEAIAKARREALASVRSNTAKQRGIEDASLKARVDCNRDDQSYRLLLDAISAANSAEPAGGLPGRVPGGSSSGEWLGPVRKALGVRNN